MGVKASFNGKEYELIYNSQSGFYEIEIEAPKTGGMYNTEITFEDLLENTENTNKKIQIWAKEINTNKSKKTLVYFLDKSNLEIKDVIEFENYEYVIDEETIKSQYVLIYELLDEGKFGRALAAGALALGLTAGHANAMNQEDIDKFEQETEQEIENIIYLENANNFIKIIDNETFKAEAIFSMLSIVAFFSPRSICPIYVGWQPESSASFS